MPHSRLGAEPSRIGNARRRARQLQSDLRSQTAAVQAHAVARVREGLDLHERTDAEIARTPLTRTQAEHVIARSAGFASWAALLKAERSAVRKGAGVETNAPDAFGLARLTRDGSVEVAGGNAGKMLDFRGGRIEVERSADRLYVNVEGVCVLRVYDAEGIVLTHRGSQGLRYSNFWAADRGEAGLREMTARSLVKSGGYGLDEEAITQIADATRDAPEEGRLWRLDLHEDEGFKLTPAATMPWTGRITDDRGLVVSDLTAIAIENFAGCVSLAAGVVEEHNASLCDRLLEGDEV